MFHWTIHLKGHDNHSPAAVVVGHKVYSFEGNWEKKKKKKKKNSVQMEVHIFNTVSLRWRKLPPWTNGRGEGSPDVPSRRVGHTAVLIAECVYIWEDILTATCSMDLMSTPTDGSSLRFLELFQRRGTTTQPVSWRR